MCSHCSSEYNQGFLITLFVIANHLIMSLRTSRREVKQSPPPFAGAKGGGYSTERSVVYPMCVSSRHSTEGHSKPKTRRFPLRGLRKSAHPDHFLFRSLSLSKGETGVFPSEGFASPLTPTFEAQCQSIGRRYPMCAPSRHSTEGYSNL